MKLDIVTLASVTFDIAAEYFMAASIVTFVCKKPNRALVLQPLNLTLHLLLFQYFKMKFEGIPGSSPGGQISGRADLREGRSLQSIEHKLDFNRCTNHLFY